MIIDYKIAQDALNELQKAEPEIVRRGVFVEESLEKEGLLFIGINPSFKEGDASTYIPGDNDYSPTYNEYNNDYFKPFQTIADALHFNSFGHHDLFPCRETSQQKIEHIVNSKNEDCITFVNKSLKWSEDIIKAANPSIIVVANAFASRLFRDFHLLGFHAVDNWSEEFGVDFINLNGEKTPVFFTGMLSGARALDTGSRTRLIWHIGFVMSNKNRW